MTLSEGHTFERAIVTSLKVEPGEEDPSWCSRSVRASRPSKRERFAAKICSTMPKNSRAMVGKVFHSNVNSKE